MNYITLKGAYGRTYKNKAEVEKDFNDNKDFMVADMFHSGRYANKSDLKGYTCNIRYNNDLKVHVIKA